MEVMQIAKELQRRIARQLRSVDEEFLKWEQAQMAAPQPAFSLPVIPGGKIVFVIFEVANGYAANVQGTTVIGKTLSETCDAAQAEAASQKAREPDGPPDEPGIEQTAKAEKFDWKTQIFDAQVEGYSAKVKAFEKTMNDAREKIAYIILTQADRASPKRHARIHRVLDWLDKHTWKL